MSNTPPLTFRRGGPTDTRAVFQVFYHSLADLNWRTGLSPQPQSDPQDEAESWDFYGSLFEHLAATADQFWIAERGGSAVGYARSILRESVRELTEFFVLPGQQSSGLGRELFKRALPRDGTSHRVIIATIDTRAQAFYLRNGLTPRFPIQFLFRPPERVTADTDLVAEPAARTQETLEAIAELDWAIIGHRRDADHTWLLQGRQGYLYRRQGRVVGYGYVGHAKGPFAVLDPADWPAVLAHAETQSAARGDDYFHVPVPLINREAVAYLLGRGYKLDPFLTFYMSDAPIGQFENYISTGPLFFV